ncbi:hypothetical protein CNEO_760019 [Clostridium neonatale]|nr:hypothetical protein CNEO_760019 [Clostridium neonatale]
MNKTKVKCPRCHSDQLYKFGLDKQANQKINVRTANANSLLTLSACRRNQNTPRVLNVVNLHSYIILISTIIDINVAIKNVIM